MMRIYLFFLGGGILFFTLLYLPTFWFSIGILICMIFITFRYFRNTIHSIKTQNLDLVRQVDDLQTQLEESKEKELKASNEADRITKAKNKLLSTVSHEVRTPMNGVIGMV